MANLKIKILLLLFTLSGVAQHKAVDPKYGSIVFTCSINVTNHELFNQFMPAMRLKQ